MIPRPIGAFDMNIRNIFLKTIVIQSVLILLLSIGISYAEDPAAISYQTVSQNKVVFTVNVSSPAPTTLIVQHYHAAGNDLVAASPRAQQIDNSRGYSKWLLRNVRPGVYPFSLTFKNTVQPDDIQLILRYRDPQGGGFFEKFARP
jgi:hypothetical protein